MNKLYAYWGCHKAADFIEANPNRYNSQARAIPWSRTDEGCCGCALGWVNHFMDAPRQYGLGCDPTTVGSQHLSVFFDRMSMATVEENCSGPHWMKYADVAAKGLRQYAETYLKPDPPGWAIAATVMKRQLLASRLKNITRRPINKDCPICHGTCIEKKTPFDVWCSECCNVPFKEDDYGEFEMNHETGAIDIL